jgi:ABC-type cobalamin transport system ATPase subunit
VHPPAPAVDIRKTELAGSLAEAGGCSRRSLAAAQTQVQPQVAPDSRLAADDYIPGSLGVAAAV